MKRYMVAGRQVLIDYTNWRGERKERVVEPVGMFFGSNEWHPGRQWLMYAKDESGTTKTFALRNIHKWEAVE